MAQANIPQSLPFLPGMSYADPKITRYHKTQLLGVKDGIITGKHKFCFDACQRFKSGRYIHLFVF